MSKIDWTLSGTLNTEDRYGRGVLDWLTDRDIDPAHATPEQLRDAFIEAAHSGEGFDPLRGSDIDGFTVHSIDDKHVHSPIEAWTINDRLTLPRRCSTCGAEDRDGTMK